MYTVNNIYIANVWWRIAESLLRSHIKHLEKYYEYQFVKKGMAKL